MTEFSVQPKAQKAYLIAGNTYGLVFTQRTLTNCDWGILHRLIMACDKEGHGTKGELNLVNIATNLQH